MRLDDGLSTRAMRLLRHEPEKVGRVVGSVWDGFVCLGGAHGLCAARMGGGRGFASF
jgi:hypothetical protein